MLLFGIICALVATASAGYASSATGAGLYNSNSYGSTYGSKYPHSNSYVGYSSAGGGGYSSPYDFQNSYQQYYNSIPALYAKKKQLTTSYAGEGASVSAYASLTPSKTRYENEMIKNLFAQQLAYQAALQNSIWQQNAAIQHNVASNIAAIRDQAYGGGYGYNSYPTYGGASAGSGAYAGGGAYAGHSGGGAAGSYGGIRPGGGTYGGTAGGPNYAAAGGSVGNGYQHQHASVYPANPARPNLDSRFGNDGVGVTHSRGPPGVVGVSSFSSSSDVNGYKQREAATSVNNNGKVTTYYTRN